MRKFVKFLCNWPSSALTTSQIESHWCNQFLWIIYINRKLRRWFELWFVISHLCKLCLCHRPHPDLTGDNLPVRCAPEVDSNNIWTHHLVTHCITWSLVQMTSSSFPWSPTLLTVSQSPSRISSPLRTITLLSQVMSWGKRQF